MSDIKIMIGLELHCQITALKSKLFCSCSSEYRNKPPNSTVCPICVGLPGTLPLLNKSAVLIAGMISMALGCKIPDSTMFYRKNYFYPDLTKNFQITQYNSYGITSIGSDGIVQHDGKTIRIRRVQLEEDPGRLVYDGKTMESSNYTLIDYNRAGMALVEIVTEPDFKDPREVHLFLNEVTSILEHLGACDTNLEGAVRCDANISIENGNRVEIKNVGSFSDVEKALNFEITRQKTLFERKIEILSQTRHWDDARKVTKQSRSKEEEQDYRYFPEPDIPSIILGSAYIDKISKNMPELPRQRKRRFIEQHSLSEHVSQVLIDRKELADFYEETLKIYYSPVEIANWLVTDMMSFIGDSEDNLNFKNLRIRPEHIAEIARLVKNDTISRSTGKNILTISAKSGQLPSEIIKQQNSTKIIDRDTLADTIDEIFKQEALAVVDAQKNPNAANFLLGKLMKKTNGRADARIGLELIRKKLMNAS